MKMKKSLLSVIMDVLGLFGLVWILIHLIGIKIFGKYIIYEDNKLVLNTEITFFTGLIVLYVLSRVYE